MEYKIFGKTVIDTEDNESIGSCIAFLGMFIIFTIAALGCFCLWWPLGILFIGICLFGLGMYIIEN